MNFKNLLRLLYFHMGIQFNQAFCFLNCHTSHFKAEGGCAHAFLPYPAASTVVVTLKISHAQQTSTTNSEKLQGID